jgi:hypothetical protein
LSRSGAASTALTIQCGTSSAMRECSWEPLGACPVDRGCLYEVRAQTAD